MSLWTVFCGPFSGMWGGLTLYSTFISYQEWEEKETELLDDGKWKLMQIKKTTSLRGMKENQNNLKKHKS
ncbi:hypothetical protein SLEP1_g36972 [Rubroshorea leprosula]|uniref:Uncharacterized protein n=1 Tax=Rubroshorea leprosula TaxID=152421 RepID=A0AAV5KTI5_9ROSI|nr:hypothetical protein SLEP1_g36972 [Rubroshorea leprosula]